MTEVKYSTHIYDLSIKRVDTPVDLGGGSINVLAVNGDCFIKINDKSQDPINLLHTANIKTEFTKFYLSNSIQVGGYVAIIIGKRCKFEITTNIARASHKPLLLPSQNIPEHLLNRVIDTPKIINVWYIKNAILRNTFNVSPQTNSLRGIFISPDGLKLYMIGQAGTVLTPTGKINEYDLSTAWDISTATLKHSLDITTQTNSPTGLFFNPDGTIVFFINQNTNTILKYTLTTAWNITTATFNTSFLASPHVNSAFDLYFSPSSHKMYIIDVTVNKLTEFNLNIPWDITTAVFKHSLDISHQITRPKSIFLSPDGLCLYVTGDIPQKVLAFRLLKAWDITSTVFKQSFDYSSIMTHSKGISFKPDGKKMYKGSWATNHIYEFDL